MNGEFTDPNRTLKEMIELVSSTMQEKMGMPGFQANMIANSFIPKLKRWQK